MIKIRKKPEEPKKMENIRDACQIDDGDTLSNILARIGDVDPKSVCFQVNVEFGYYDDTYTHVYARWTRPETDKEFEKRKLNYIKELDKYNEWYEENKEVIETELEKRQTSKEEKERQKKDREEKKERQRKDREAKTLEEDIKAAQKLLKKHGII